MKTGSNVINIWFYSSPCGDLILGSFEERLCLCSWVNSKRRSATDRKIKKELNADYVECKTDVIESAISQLDEYFAGKRREFNVPLLFVGTDFQKNVWDGLLKIPYGETVSYGEFAKRLNCPSSVRAVANSNGANPIAIIAPCHRVIGSDGTLTGYAGGLDIKSFLLDLEQKAAVR